MSIAWVLFIGSLGVTGIYWVSFPALKKHFVDDKKGGDRK